MNTGKQNTLNELAKLTNCLKVYILLSLPHGAGAHVCGNTYVRYTTRVRVDPYLRIRMRDVNNMNTPSNPITWIHNVNTAQITHVIMSTALRIDQSDGDRCA